MMQDPRNNDAERRPIVNIAQRLAVRIAIIVMSGMITFSILILTERFEWNIIFRLSLVINSVAAFMWLVGKINARFDRVRAGIRRKAARQRHILGVAQARGHRFIMGLPGLPWRNQVARAVAAELKAEFGIVPFGKTELVDMQRYATRAIRQALPDVRGTDLYELARTAAYLSMIPSREDVRDASMFSPPEDQMSLLERLVSWYDDTDTTPLLTRIAEFERAFSAGF
jgi:hypothetical protein